MAEHINIEIPENADKFLFAEDLIRNVMLRNGTAPYFTCRAGPYRRLIYNGYNETTEMAVQVLYQRIAYGYDRGFQHFRMRYRIFVTHGVYTRIANEITERFFPSGFLADRFLLFCVHIASLAANYYTHGILEAPDLAVLYIVKPIQDIDMTTGGWDTMNRTAQMYATMTRNSLNMLPQETWAIPDIST